MTLHLKSGAAPSAMAAPLWLWRRMRRAGPRGVARGLAGLAAAAIAAVALFVACFTNHVYVTTPSMYPTLPPGSVAIIEKAPVYHLGDIIEFHGNGLVFMHRIIKISASGDITTKGDNPENSPDVFFPPTTKADVMGRVVVGSRWLGFPELFAHHPAYALAWLRAELGLKGKLVVLALSGVCFLGVGTSPRRKGAGAGGEVSTGVA